jgi:hypothetical protein
VNQLHVTLLQPVSFSFFHGGESLAKAVQKAHPLLSQGAVARIANARDNDIVAYKTEGKTLRRFIIPGLVLAIALAGSASAGTLYRFPAPQTVQGGQMVAGDIKADGKIVYGKGFTASRTGPGTYYIEFPNGYFAPSGCASMVVEPSSAKPLTSDVTGICTPHPYFRVIFFNAIGHTQDAAFHFIVVQYS